METYNRATGEPVEPLGWQGDGLDFELSRCPEVGPRWEWNAYRHADLVARGYARTRLGAHVAMFFVNRDHKRGRLV